jgi:predicted nuclease of predicted toxin-antitoxin system
LIHKYLALWIRKTLDIDAYSLEYLKLDEAEDEDIFMAAREANAVVMTKDEDFVQLQKRFGIPANDLDNMWKYLERSLVGDSYSIFTIH